jgi:hypothetical protein
LIILIIFGEKCMLTNIFIIQFSLLLVHPLFGTNIFLSILFPNTLSAYVVPSMSETKFYIHTTHCFKLDGNSWWFNERLRENASLPLDEESCFKSFK